MSKKDFQAIARAIHQTAHWLPGAPARRVVRIEDVTAMIADVLAESNPRFDRARFAEACETGRCKGMAR